MLTSFLHKIAFIGVVCLVGLSGCGGGNQSPSVSPAITAQPADLTVTEGNSANFSVVASGDASLRYQWKRNGMDIEGATASSYVLPNVQLADSGSTWSVVVSNATGSVTSIAATLTVKTGPGLSLLAGRLGGAGNTDGSQGRFMEPTAVATDKAGNLYVKDADKIRKVTLNGVITTLAGVTASDVSAITVDHSDNLYLADYENNAIRKITPAGAITTLAGTPGFAGSADGIGAAASFNRPSGIAADEAGNLHVADRLNNTVRKITPAGVVTTLAGTPQVTGSADGIGTAASFTSINGIAVDESGNVYVTDYKTIRKITPAGVVTTLAGSASDNTYGQVDGLGAAARFSALRGLAVDGSGNLYAADDTTIRKITPDGVVTTLAGKAGVRGASDGTGMAASFSIPTGVAVDRMGNIYISETVQQFLCPAIAYTPDTPQWCNSHKAVSNTIRKITPDGVVTTLAGTSGVTGSADGIGAAASFHYPNALAVDETGNVFVADIGNATIRKITPNGVVTTVAGKAGSLGVLLGSLPASLGASSDWILEGIGFTGASSGLAVGPNGVLYTTTENAVLKVRLE